MPLSVKQISAIRYGRRRTETEKELDTRANFGAIAGADLAAVHEANRSLVEGWMDNRGDIYGPSCARRRPRSSFAYSADRSARCAGCQRTVGECQAARYRRRVS